MGVGVWRRGAEWASKTARGSRSGKKTSFLSFCVLRAVRLSVPRCFSVDTRGRVSGAVTSVLLERPPCGRRCVRARGWLLMSSKAMGGRKAVSHQVKLGWHVKIRRRGIYFARRVSWGFVEWGGSPTMGRSAHCGWIVGDKGTCIVAMQAGMARTLDRAWGTSGCCGASGSLAAPGRT